MNIRLGIRTHFYDRCVEYAYREWQKLLGDKVFLLVDETRGPVDVGDARKLSWTESDAADLGLPLTPPAKVPWYNGDYHIYHMIPHMKADDFCFLVEHDVFLKVSDKSRLLGLLETCAEHDFIATRIGPRRQNWSWVRDLDTLYTVVHGAAVMILGFNRRSAEYLLERRLELQRERMRVGSDQWPMVEAFIGTEVFGLESFKIGDMQVLGSLAPDQLRTTPPYLIDERMANAPADALYHPCLPRERILSKFRSIFRTSPPNPRIWNALLPFVSTASDAEMKKLDWLAQKFWNTPSFLAAFPDATVPASVSRAPHE